MGLWKLPDLTGIRDLNSKARDAEPTISPPVPAKRKTDRFRLKSLPRAKSDGPGRRICRRKPFRFGPPA